MTSWEPPTRQQLEQVALQAARPESRSYFFDRLENPLWVRPLADAGFFASPPEPVNVDGGYVQFPSWPEGRYLARVASVAPEDVAEVLAGLPVSESPTVARHVIEAAVGLSDATLSTLASDLPRWFEGPHVQGLGEEAAAISARLVEIGETEAGLRVLGQMLDAAPVVGDESEYRYLRDPATRISEWEYEQLLAASVPLLAERVGVLGLKFLQRALWRATGGTEEGARSASYTRAAIEDHAQDHASGVLGALITAERDIALHVASSGDEARRTTLDLLEAGSVIDQRIALHVLSQIDQEGDRAARWMTDVNSFDALGIRHEFAGLLRARFAELSDENQAVYLNWVAEGPDRRGFVERAEQFAGERPDDAEVDRYASAWQRDHYSYVADALKGSDRIRYQELVGELGEPDHPDFLTWSTSWSGSTSPVDEDEMSSWPLEEVIAFLRSWEPDTSTRWGPEPSIEGLSHVFGRVVASKLDEYIENSTSLEALDPTYVRTFLQSVEAAVRERKVIDWPPVLQLAQSVLGHPFEPDIVEPDKDRDPGWRWCRSEIASLLRTGFQDHEGHIPSELSSEAWELLEGLLGDPNPSPEHEKTYDGSNMDPLTLSLNTTRGRAMHAVAEFVLWRRRMMEASGEDVSHVIEAHPQVAAALQAHLDPEVDPSLAVRAVYGKWLPWFILADEGWVTSVLDQMLPEAPELQSARDAVWATYVIWCPPFDSAWRVLQAQYIAAIGRRSTLDGDAAFAPEKEDASLGQHLITFYWRGLASADVIDSYLDHADDRLAAKLISFIGRSLANSDEVPAAVLRRIMEFWERRSVRLAADPGAHLLELRAFGSWFVADSVPRSWATPHFEMTLELAGGPDLSHQVAEQLLLMSESDPATAIRLLAMMVERPAEPWDRLGYRGEAREVVARAMSANDAAARGHAEAVVDTYVTGGELSFRELLE